MSDPTRTLAWLLAATLLLAVSSASAMDRGHPGRDRDDRHGGGSHHARGERTDDRRDWRRERHDHRRDWRRQRHDHRRDWRRQRRGHSRVFIGRDGYGHVDMGGGCKVWFDARGDRTANTRHCSAHQFRRAHEVRARYRPGQRW